MLLEHTRQQSRESATLSEVLAGPLAQRLSHIAEDVGRIVKKVGTVEGLRIQPKKKKEKKKSAWGIYLEAW